MEKIKKTVIITGYDCNNFCRFCINSNKRDIPIKNTAQIISEMKIARKNGSTYLELIGGEVTIRDDVLLLFQYAKKLGFKTIMIATNGRMFSYFDFAKKSIEAGLNHIVFSIHGHNDKLHDFLTQAPGSFDQLVKGINNFKKLGFKNLGTNTTVVKQNYKFLPAIAKLIFDMGIKNSEYIFVDPTYGAAYDNFNKFVPKISTTAPYFKKVLDFARKKRISDWTVRYVPLCYFQKYKNYISELREVKNFSTQHLAPDFVNKDVSESRKNIARAKPKRCKKCVLYNQCEGVWKEYLKYYGDKELKPILK